MAISTSMGIPSNFPRSERAAPCDLCGEATFEIIDHKDRHGGDLNTVICRNCGLVSHETIPSNEEVDHFYSQEYRQSYKGEWHPSPKRVVRAWGTAQRLYRSLAKHVKPGDRVFDVGGGVGCVVKAFELAGFDASGIEPNEGFQSYSRSHLRTRLERCRLCDVPPEPAYDMVILLHVIEHFVSPRAALTHIHRILRPGGRLYLECPNVAAPHAAPGNQFHFAHIYNFSTWTLTAMAQATGFRLIDSLSGERGKHLKQVFVREEEANSAIDVLAYEKTLAGVKRYGRLGYYLRPSYLASRALQLSDRLVEQLTAKQRLQRILHTCQQSPFREPPSDLDAKKKAA